jgi:tellurite methyltransferase
MSSIPNNPISTWPDYYQATLSKPLHPLFFTLEPYLPSSGKAIDLGCGVGHAVVWLADKGWQVDAVDGHEDALKIVSSRLSEEGKTRVQLKQERLEDVKLEGDAYDLVVAAFSLFFIESRDALVKTWGQIRGGLKPGGLFIGEFLGLNDDWSDRCLVNTRSEVEGFLSGWEVIHFEEAEQDGQTSQGVPKHWHIFHVIARKP